MKKDLEDKIYDYAIRHIRKQKTFCDDAYFEQWNESIKVNGIIQLEKATMIDMAMAYIEGEMTYIVYEYFSHQEEPTMAEEHNFPFEIYDYGHYISLLEHANPYIHSEVRDLSDLVDYIDEKYSSLLGSFYYS
tara:strand:- start:103 stop:501 length:399 start_codon:yes stop_codon:yes gene_type:complete